MLYNESMFNSPEKPIMQRTPAEWLALAVRAEEMEKVHSLPEEVVQRLYGDILSFGPNGCNVRKLMNDLTPEYVAAYRDFEEHFFEIPPAPLTVRDNILSELRRANHHDTLYSVGALLLLVAYNGFILNDKYLWAEDETAYNTSVALLGLDPKDYLYQPPAAKQEWFR